ncbi:hypothetical protein B0H34DRAFT_781657 [Crassisporium funariophilum]|nr:hypothetical protein B0H34DRAFT_781657 [Crassisporium funariophilum]
MSVTSDHSQKYPLSPFSPPHPSLLNPNPVPLHRQIPPLNTIPTPQPPKKHKIDLRPGPIKQNTPTLSASHLIPPKPIRTKSATEPSAPAFSAAKEQVLKDLHNAEAHGILKPPPADANWFKRTLHQAIELLKFYYRGVKLIFLRRKDIAMIKARIKEGGTSLTRSEFRLIQTQKDDINKVIPFLIIAVLLEEVIPLIAIYAPFMLPSTCILPSQRLRIETKRAEKAQAFAAKYAHVYPELKRSENPAGFLPLASLRLEGASTAACALLGLSTIGIDALRIRRIRRHLEFIIKDDQLLLQAAHAHPLSHRELKEAVEERGILMAQGLSHKELQSRLSTWLNAIKDSSETVDDSAIARRLALLFSRV